MLQKRGSWRRIYHAAYGGFLSDRVKGWSTGYSLLGSNTNKSKMSRLAYTRHHSSHGFSLIEILVSLLILAVGLLGVAALQLSAMHKNSSALFYSQATYLAYDMADRIRANPEANYTLASTNTVQSAATDCEAPTITCTADEVAAFDIAQWTCAVIGRGCGTSFTEQSFNNGSNRLPNARVDIIEAADASGWIGNTRTITISWLDEKGNTSQFNDPTVTPQRSQMTLVVVPWRRTP